MIACMSEQNRPIEHTLLLSDIHEALSKNIGRATLTSTLSRKKGNVATATILGIVDEESAPVAVHVNQLLLPNTEVSYLVHIKVLDDADYSEIYTLDESVAKKKGEGPIDDETIEDVRYMIAHADWKEADFDPMTDL